MLTVGNQKDKNKVFQPKLFSIRHGLDPFLIGILSLTLFLGLVTLYSATNGNESIIIRQLIHIVLGIAIMCSIASVNVQLIRDITPFLYIAVIVLLISVEIIGNESKGAQRWLEIPGLPRFQPSELAKIGVPAMIAWSLTRFDLPPKGYGLFFSLVCLAIPVGLIVLQPDLGTAVLIAISGGMVLFFAGISWRYMIFAGFIFMSFLPIVWSTLHGYQKQRVLTFLDPQADPLGTGWNTIQSMTALGSGGLTGKGYLLGTQARLNFLPEAHTDFAAAVLGEEFGILGLVTLLGLYLLIFFRALTLAMRSGNHFSRILSATLCVSFFIHVLVNLGMISGALPIVGVPLPFISYGGTSTISLCMSFGLIMALQRRSRSLVVDL